ncbi:MAG TPA: glycosyltransferase [Candidatus Angelobacter sp.]|nr:glycosyltransferase [Candidatus Angelobacter sp.]
MKIFVFGSSITSCYWNGAATYYRGIYKALHALGHQITFAEPDAYGRQQHKDGGDYSYVKSIVYTYEHEIPKLFYAASESDLVIKHSGVGVFDEFLEAGVLHVQSAKTKVAFWDVDAPATLSRVESDRDDAFRRLIPKYDYIFTYGGGSAVMDRYLRLGAASCHTIYNALSPESHFPTSRDSSLLCDLAFVGNRLPDREHRVEEFFLRVAQLEPGFRFILAGEGWANKPLPQNVRWIGHLGTSKHNSVNCSARMVLNVNRDSMAGAGFSPPTRIFEAAGAGACVITDHWPGIEAFFEPGREVLVASHAGDVVKFLKTISHEEAGEIAQKMRQRALQEHTYELRAAQVNRVLNRGTSAIPHSDSGLHLAGLGPALGEVKFQ